LGNLRGGVILRLLDFSSLRRFLIGLNLLVNENGHDS